LQSNHVVSITLRWDFSSFSAEKYQKCHDFNIRKQEQESSVTEKSFEKLFFLIDDEKNLMAEQ
jgi:hypothetical protein